MGCWVIGDKSHKLNDECKVGFARSLKGAFLDECRWYVNNGREFECQTLQVRIHQYMCDFHRLSAIWQELLHHIAGQGRDDREA